MARYKYIDSVPRFLAVDRARRLLLGTVERALVHLLVHGIDLYQCDTRFRSDPTGAPAHPPAVLLNVALFAYSQGIVSSRGIECGPQGWPPAATEPSAESMRHVRHPAVETPARNRDPSSAASWTVVSRALSECLLHGWRRPRHRRIVRRQFELHHHKPLVA